MARLERTSRLFITALAGLALIASTIAQSAPPLPRASLWRVLRRAPGVPTTTLLERTLDERIAAFQTDLPWMDRQLFSALEGRMRARIERSCASLSFCGPEDLSRFVTEAIERSAGRDLALARKIRGYAVILGSMVGSAAVTSSLTGSLPEDARFLSQLLTQISVIGIYVMGAPVWKPLTSVVERWAFNLGTHATGEENSTRAAAAPPEQAEIERLERLWAATQATYSMNAQMSRNVMNAFLGVLRENFHAAFLSMRGASPTRPDAYVLDQVAETAITLRRMYAEIPADDPGVTLAARTALLDHLESAEKPLFREDLLRRLSQLDADFGNKAVRAYYERLLDGWLRS